LLVGNHSSGKSSFINYVLGRKIQTAGVAPTDDSFTIIAPGPADRDQDGPALIGDPDLGFSQLRQFGPTLMHHTALKIRSGIESNFIMVDSPGMIDAPANYFSGMVKGDAGRVMDRGYDFPGVVRWYADRADIVCLFFDPDKPGTTGETLSVRSYGVHKCRCTVLALGVDIANNGLIHNLTLRFLFLSSLVFLSGSVGILVRHGPQTAHCSKQG
jgi:hypothetical protein